MRNANLLRLANSKKANLEAAFSETCQQQIVVQLAVAAVAFDAPDATDRKPTDPPPDRQPLPDDTPPPPAIEPTPEPPAARKRQSKANSASKPASTTRKRADATAKVNRLPEDLQEAARSLVGEFDGDLIDLGDRALWQESSPALAEEAPKALPTWEAPGDFGKSKAPDGDAGGDVGDLDGEVPFARQPPGGEFWDCWEIAAHQPGCRAL